MDSEDISHLTWGSLHLQQIDGLASDGGFEDDQDTFEKEKCLSLSIGHFDVDKGSCVLLGCEFNKYQ